MTTESFALELLGANVPQVQVASALGITESAVSQMMANSEFAAKVQKIRFDNARKFNERDNKYEQLEDAMLQKLSDSLPFFSKPHEIIQGLKAVNGAVRRGQASMDNQQMNKPVVQLNLPVAIIQKIVVSGRNEVVKAGEVELVTIDNKQLEMLAAQRQPEIKELPNEYQRQGTRKSLASRDITVADL